MNNNENDTINKYQDDTEKNSVSEEAINEGNIIEQSSEGETTAENSKKQASDEKTVAEDSEEQASDEDIATEDVEEQVSDEDIATEDIEEQVYDEDITTEDSEEQASDEDITTEDVEEQVSDEDITTEDVEEQVSDEDITTEDVEEQASDEDIATEDIEKQASDEDIVTEDVESVAVSESVDSANAEMSVEQIIAEMSSFNIEMTEEAIEESVVQAMPEPMVEQEAEIMSVENMPNEPQQPVFEEIFSDSGKNKVTEYNDEFRDKVAQCMVDMGSERVETKKKVSLFKISIFALLSVVLLVVGVLAYSSLTSSPEMPSNPTGPATNVNTNYDEDEDEERFAPDIRIAGVNMEGKTFDVARKVLAKRESELVKKFIINIPYKDDVYSITQDDFTYLFDTDEVFKKAIDYSKMVKKDGELYEDDEYPLIQDTTSGEKYVDFELSYVLDESSVDGVVKGIAEKIEEEMVEPHVGKFTPLGGDNRFTIVNGKNGLTLDKDDLKDKIITSLKTDKDTIDLELKTSVVKPTKKKSQIKKEVVLISSYTTISYNNYYGNENMRLALSKINGSIIKTGDVLSFNKCTGNSNLPEEGWQPATVIAGGKLETGYGGGICQAASTLYNAALKANMTVIERFNHLWPSSYVPKGLDATIDYGNLDLKLRNDSEYTMYFECYMEGTTLYVNIYGHKDTSFDKIELEASVDGYIDQPPTIYTIDYSKADDYYSTTRYGNSGTIASARRIFYKNGKQIKVEELHGSVYDALATLVTVGPGYDSNGIWRGGTSSGGSSSSRPSSSRPSSSRPSSSRPSSSTPVSSKPVDPPSSTPVISEPPIVSEPVTSEPPIVSEPVTSEPVSEVSSEIETEPGGEG